MKIFLLSFSFFLVFIGNAQVQYKNFHFTTDEGLPSNTIYGITEDNSGNIVLGTENGLTFFDGNEFKTVNVKEGLINPNIVAVANDNDGTIWFINYGDRLQKLQNNKIINTSVFCEYYNQILITKKSLFLYTTQAINKNNGYTNIELLKQKGLKINADTLVKIKKMAAPVLAQNNEEIHYKDNCILYNEYKVPVPNQVKLLHKVIFRKNDVCILDEFNLFIVDFKGKILNSIKLPQPLSEKRFFKYDFIVDHQENCWLNIQGKGLFILKNKQWVSLQKSLGLKIDDNINFLFCDTKGRLWIATNTKGLFCIPSSLIETIYIENKENNFIGFATALDMQTLFIASNFNLYSYKNQQFNLLEETSIPLKIDNFNNNPVCYFPYFQTLSSDKKMKSLQGILGRQLLKKEGEKYFSLFGMSGIVIHEKKNSAVKVHYILNKVPTNEKIRKVIYYKKNYYFNNSGNINIRTFDDNFIYTTRNLNLNLKGTIRDFIFIKDTMWVATNDVIYKVFNEKTVDSITQINGVKPNNLQKIKLIGNDKYLCAGNGLFVLSKNGNRVLNKFNFLPSNDVNNVALFQNNLFIATSDGLGKINNEIINKKAVQPILNIFYNNHSTVAINTTPEVESIDLQLKIQNFYSSKNQLVQYKTDNSFWANCNENSIIIPVQSYGKHAITIRAKDINSDWTVKTVTINRAFPFYFKWWFISITIVLLIGVLYWIYRLKIAKIKQKQQQEIAISNKIIELRQNALSALMNPHFLFNSLSSIQYFINSNQTQKSSDYLGKLARLARLFLLHASDSFINLEEEINRLKIYIELEQVRFNNFKFNLYIDQKIDLSTTKIPNMIVQPFIENAILHGISHLVELDGIITLNFFIENQLLTIEVVDNGYGIDKYRIKKNSHISKGIDIIKERIKILQQSYPEKLFSIKQESVFPNQDRKGHKVTIKVTILT
nr:histidine kinase [uncultured Flavobacterium sp.]